MSRTRVKICCIANVEEATLAIRAGADALGLVSAMPSGPGPVDELTIAAIARSAPPPLATFLLTCQTRAAGIIAQHHRTRTTTLQLVDHVPLDELLILRTALPGIKLVQVIHVCDEQSVQEAIHVAPHVDALLLDSGRPSLAIKELGGTGRVHDWSLSRSIVEQVSLPVFLAGGLNASNVADAIRTVRPFGIDLCNGVRTAGRLDAEKLELFFDAVTKMQT